MFNIAKDKYKCILEVNPQDTFHCPKSGITGKWAELTEAQCKLMIEKGNDCIEKIDTTDSKKPAKPN